MDGRKRSFADNDKAVFHRIMQRFRPIIPKPTTLDSGSAVKGGDEKSNCVRAGGGGKCKIRRRKGVVERERDSIFTTLQLLPADQLPIGRRGKDSDDHILLPNTTTPTANTIIMTNGLTLLRAPLLLDRTVETWVTVERVTGNCMDGRGLGCTDEELITNLERDTCPGFISDGLNEVRWVNMAYRRMVWEEERGSAPPPQVVVKLMPPATAPDLTELALIGFACRVRVQYYCNYYYYNMSNCLEKQCRQIVVPCDVWRMEFGGLAWRLDVQAALSLGR